MNLSSDPAKSNPSEKLLFAIKATRGAFKRVKYGFKEWRNYLVIATVTGLLLGFLPFFSSVKKAEADLETDSQELNSTLPETLEQLTEKLILLQENSLLSLNTPLSFGSDGTQQITVVVTAYSSTPWETDSDPFVTAAGTEVKDGIVANNLWPIGTIVRFPEIYGDKVFVVEDRMHWRKSSYVFDIWFPSNEQALEFGAKITEALVISN